MELRQYPGKYYKQIVKNERMLGWWLFEFKWELNMLSLRFGVDCVRRDSFHNPTLSAIELDKGLQIERTLKGGSRLEIYWIFIPINIEIKGWQNFSSWKGLATIYSQLIQHIYIKHEYFRCSTKLGLYETAWKLVCTYLIKIENTMYWESCDNVVTMR